MLPGVCLIAVVVLMELLIKNKRDRAGGIPPMSGVQAGASEHADVSLLMVGASWGRN